jgi:hypothetical protein
LLQIDEGDPTHPGIPSVVVVGQAVVVVVVDDPQQKPTLSGASWVSPDLHASRILTVALNVPSFLGLAQRTAASETVTQRMSVVQARGRRSDRIRPSARTSDGAAATGCQRRFGPPRAAATGLAPRERGGL